MLTILFRSKGHYDHKEKCHDIIEGLCRRPLGVKVEIVFDGLWLINNVDEIYFNVFNATELGIPLISILERYLFDFQNKLLIFYADLKTLFQFVWKSLTFWKISGKQTVEVFFWLFLFNLFHLYLVTIVLSKCLSVYVGSWSDPTLQYYWTRPPALDLELNPFDNSFPFFISLWLEAVFFTCSN